MRQMPGEQGGVVVGGGAFEDFVSGPPDSHAIMAEQRTVRPGIVQRPIRRPADQLKEPPGKARRNPVCLPELRRQSLSHAWRKREGPAQQAEQFQRAAHQRHWKNTGRMSLCEGADGGSTFGAGDIIAAIGCVDHQKAATRQPVHGEYWAIRRHIAAIKDGLQAIREMAPKSSGDMT